jgi:CheY-like chemotaxis protein/HPt (histidine-containing phosphotransfer) domain-containing protein
VPGIKSARILLAEDHAINRQVMLALLKQLGYSAEPVGNGYEAVEALRTGHYDLVFMDCQMPDMDGYEATRLIRDPAIGARNPRIPIVAVTAGAMAGDKQKCLDAGMDDYISKPIEPDKLAQTLEKWLSGGEAAEPAALAEIPALAVFDREALLKRLMGNQGLADRVMNAFLETAPSQLLTLRRQLDGHDAPGILREAHSLKGSAATVSAPGLRSLAVEAEDAAKAGEWSKMEGILPRMEDQLDQLRAAVAEPIPA